MHYFWEFQIRNTTVGRSSNWESSSIWEVLWALKNLQKELLHQADELTHFYFHLTTGSMEAFHTGFCESAVSSGLKWSFIQGSSSTSLFTFDQLSGFFFYSSPALGSSSTCVPNIFQRGFQARGLWDSLESPLLEQCPLLLTPRWHAHVQHLPCPKDRKYVTSWSFTYTEFTLLSPCHSFCLQETKPDYLPCFCCYFCFEVWTGVWC